MSDYSEYRSGHSGHPGHGGCSTPAGHSSQSGMYPAYYQNAYDDPAVFYHSQQFWKGIALGAIAAIFVTNEGVQKAVMKGAIKLYDMVQSGANELKEKFEDAQAEVRQKAEAEE